MLQRYGEVPERSKGADCKSVGTAFEGSNPSLSKKPSSYEEGFFLFWTHEVPMSQPFYASGLKFSCIGCGHCCGGGVPGYVFLSWEDLERLAVYKGISQEQFLAEYCRKVDMGTYYRVSLCEKKNFDCIFLSGNGCDVYEARPLQCRTYPFWDFIVESSSSWLEESQECPGIGQGKNYTQEEIEAILALRRGEKLITLEQ